MKSMGNNLDSTIVMVTGGAGHLGSHIVDELLTKNVSKIKIYDNMSEGRESNLKRLPKDAPIELIRDDIRDYEDLEIAMKGVDYVFHTASLLLLECRDHPYKAIDVNIKGTYNVIHAAIESGVKKIIFSSSSSVHGEPLYTPVDEDHPMNSEIMYGTTKIAGEHLFRDHYKSHDLEYIGLRYFNIYGPRQHYKGAYAQIVPRWVDQIFAGQPITIYGDGSQTLDMIYVTDVAKANILALESNVTNDFINIGTGISSSVLEIANALQDIANDHRPAFARGKLSITFIPQDINLIKRRQCNTAKAERLINFKYSIGLKEGLRNYYEWRIYD